MKRSRREFMVGTGATLAGIALGGCQDAPKNETTNATPAAPAPGGATNYTLGCIIPTLNHPFFVAMARGLNEGGSAAGAKINVVDGKDKDEIQLNAIDTFIVQKVSAIVLCPTRTETIGAGVAKANQAGIPVVTVNRTVNEGDVVTYVGADDREGGRMQGQALVKALNGKGKVVVLEGVIGSSPQINRTAGLKDVLKDNAGIQILRQETYNFQADQAVKVMENVLTAYAKGKIDAVVAHSDDGALAAIQVCERQNRPEIKIIGFNGEKRAFDAVKAGSMYATILQDAATQGREGVNAAIKHLKGEKVENPMITPLVLITQETVGANQPAWE